MQKLRKEKEKKVEWKNNYYLNLIWSAFLSDDHEWSHYD